MTPRFVRGSHQAAVEARSRGAGGRRVIERLWDKDPTLWSDDPAHHAVAANRLGWLDVAPRMRAEADAMRDLRASWRARGHARLAAGHGRLEPGAGSVSTDVRCGPGRDRCPGPGQHVAGRGAGRAPQARSSEDGVHRLVQVGRHPRGGFARGPRLGVDARGARAPVGPRVRGHGRPRHLARGAGADARLSPLLPQPAGHRRPLPRPCPTSAWSRRRYGSTSPRCWITPKRRCATRAAGARPVTTSR